MVNLIEDWDVLAEYAGEKLGFYQLLGNDGAIEIRVQTGRIGYKKEYKAGDDPELLSILDFCKKNRYIQISNTSGTKSSSSSWRLRIMTTVLEERVLKSNQQKEPYKKRRKPCIVCGKPSAGVTSYVFR